MADDISRDLLEPADVQRIPLAAEQAQVTKRRVSKGRVSVRTVNETRDELIRDELAGERISVERVSIGRTLEFGEPPPAMRTEGDVTVIPVVEEVLVVSKQLVLKEELRITRHATREAVEFPVTIRSQRAVIERTGPQGSPTQPAQSQSTLGEEPQQ